MPFNAIAWSGDWAGAVAPSTNEATNGARARMDQDGACMSFFSGGCPRRPLGMRIADRRDENQARSVESRALGAEQDPVTVRELVHSSAHSRMPDDLARLLAELRRLADAPSGDD